MIKLFSKKLTVTFLWLLAAIFYFCFTEASFSAGQQLNGPPGVKSATAESITVARIAYYVITREELEKKLMTELYPYDHDSYDENAKPADAKTVLMKMLAEKAMIIEARAQGYLKNEAITTSVKRFMDRKLVDLLFQRIIQGRINITADEIKQKMQADPKLDEARAKTMIERAKTSTMLDQYYRQIYSKSGVKKLSQNFPRVIQIHDRLLRNPKKDRKASWIQTSQVREELSEAEKNIVLAQYANGKITLKDWFEALCDIVPPRRPQDLNTPQGVNQLLERALRMPLLVSEAKTLGLDRNKDLLKQVRDYEDRRLLSETLSAKRKELKEPTTEQIIAYFGRNKESFGTGKSLKIDLIWCQDLKAAKQVKAALESGKDFEAVRQQFSPEKKGKPFTTHPGSEGLFWKDLWAGDPNQIIGPVKGFYQQGISWRIVKIMEKVPGKEKLYSTNMDGQIRSRIMSEQNKALIARYGKELLSKYPHQIYADKIKDIDPLGLEKEPKIVSEEVRKEPKIASEEVRKEPKTEFEEARKDLSSLERFVRTQALHTLPKAFQQEVEETFAHLLLSSDLGERFVIGAFLNVARKTIPDREKGSVTISEAGSNLVRFELEYPKDRQPFGAGGASIPVGHGSIWRFKGRVTDIMGFDFEGKENDPLRFILVDGYGLIYLYGTGAVVFKDGTVVTFPKD